MELAALKRLKISHKSLILGLWFPWPIYMFFEMRFDLGTLDSGERSLPFGLLVSSPEPKVHKVSL